MSINANGNTAVVGKTLTVFPFIGNSSYASPAAASDSSEALTSVAQSFTFTSANENKTVVFNSVPLLYSGQNFYGFYAFTQDGTLEGLIGGSTTPLEYIRTYTGSDLPVYRFYSSKFANAHFFTQNATEKENLISNDNITTGGNWNYESRAFTATQTSNGTCTGVQAPVYRFYSSRFGSHFYTANVSEKTNLLSDSNWTLESVAYCADTSQVSGTTALYRFWSPRFGKHFFTANVSEKDSLVANDNYASGGNWTFENTAYFVQP